MNQNGDKQSEIAQLLHEGRHREAAELLLDRGDQQGAMQAFAAAWDYSRAAEVARAAQDRAAALDYLLRAGERTAVSEVLEELSDGTETEAERALELLLRRGEKDYAARLLEARGQLARAAVLVQALGELRQAASLYERAGQYREAGRLYERLVQTDPTDGAAALCLGQILRRYGKHELAARMFQSAAKQEELKRPALRGLVCSLDALGLCDAAESALAELLELDASVPPAVPAFVAAEAEQERKQAGGVDDLWFNGRYHVQRLIGGGAVGRVYLARDALFDRDVALKVLSSGGVDRGSRDAFGRFVREAQVTARLEHPNIIKVLDFQRDTGVLVMEYLDGGTLADRLGQGPLSLDQLQSLLQALLAALETAHLRGVVHRDVKPQNVLFARAGGIKLADFGIAHLQDLGLTQTGAFIGTLTYMAPEQITGGKVSAATDLYALGATLYHALCGQPPFSGADLVAQHLAATPRPPSSLRPEVGPRFDDLLGRLLAKAPADRFASAAEVRRRAAKVDFTDPGICTLLPPPGPPPSAEPRDRYVELEPRSGPEEEQLPQVLDRPLELPVLLRHPARPEEIAHYQRLAPVMSPYLQCVLEADCQEQRVVLEQPPGTVLAELAERLELPRSLVVIDHLATALETLHQAERAHGSVAADRVVLAEHRTVLLLPLPEGAPSTPAQDAQDLVALWSLCLGTTGNLSRLLSPEGPLAATLGQRRRRTLLASLPATLDVVTVGQVARQAQAALADRRHQQRHLHALAAAARARGADPHRGPLAEFMRQRRAEFDR